MDGCISMVEVAPERESVTWGEITEKRPEITTDWDAMKHYKDYRDKMNIDIH